MNTQSENMTLLDSSDRDMNAVVDERDVSLEHAFPDWMSDPACKEPTVANHKKQKHRSIWVSDVHLGTKGSRADLLCDFLKYNNCETLYLVGDIIDGWRMKKKAYWPQPHVNVIRRILTSSKRGTRVVYVTGNHDEFLRRYSGMSFGNIHLVDEFIHKAPNGEKHWVVHGDAFDTIVRNKKWLAIIGDWAYVTLIKLNIIFNRMRSLLGMDYWSLSAYLKYKVKKAVSFITDYEQVLATECKKRKLQGVICGHIHHPEIRIIEGIRYANSGDWVESCSALVEDYQGNLEVVKWSASLEKENVKTESAVGGKELDKLEQD